MVSQPKIQGACALTESYSPLGTQKKKQAFEALCGNFHDENVPCQEADDLDSWDQEEFSRINAVQQTLKAKVT